MQRTFREFYVKLHVKFTLISGLLFTGNSCENFYMKFVWVLFLHEITCIFYVISREINLIFHVRHNCLCKANCTLCKSQVKRASRDFTESFIWNHVNFTFNLRETFHGKFMLKIQVKFVWVLLSHEYHVNFSRDIMWKHREFHVRHNYFCTNVKKVYLIIKIRSVNSKRNIWDRIIVILCSYLRLKIDVNIHMHI